MINELPELDDFFSSSSTSKEKKKPSNNPVLANEISIYISKDNETWVEAEFIDLAVGRIGLHVALNEQIELTTEESNNLRIKFTKLVSGEEKLLRKSAIQVRWQETDTITGKLKLGLHFHADVKEDHVMQDIFTKLKGIK